MNARTVNISSLVILLALLSLICEGFLYLFFAITNMVDRICSISISRIITLFFGIIL